MAATTVTSMAFPFVLLLLLSVAASFVACDKYVLIVTNQTFAGDFQASVPGGIDAICEGPDGGNSPIWKGFLQNGTAVNYTLDIPDNVNNTFYNIENQVIVANVTMLDLYAGNEIATFLPKKINKQDIDAGSFIRTGASFLGVMECACNGFTACEGQSAYAGFHDNGTGTFNFYVFDLTFDSRDCDSPGYLYCYAKYDDVFFATVSGDPHFVGFNGCKYNFGGVDGGVYAIYSDVDLQVNAQLGKLAVRGVDGTWMTKVGIRTADAVVVFDPSEGLLNAQDLTLIVSGEIATFNTSKIQMKVNENDGRIDEMTMVTPHARIRVEVKRFGDGPRDFFLNIDFVILAPPVSAHGVLGQTARALGDDAAAAADSADCSRPVAGSEDDYLVRDGIVGTDFVFQQYQMSVSRGREARSFLEQPFAGSANWDI